MCSVKTVNTIQVHWQQGSLPACLVVAPMTPEFNIKELPLVEKQTENETEKTENARFRKWVQLLEVLARTGQTRISYDKTL